MALQTLSPEENELLDLLEGHQPVNLARFNLLIEQLLEHAWPILVRYLSKRCVQADISAEQMAIDTCVAAYEILQQQISCPAATRPEAAAMCYSRSRCPQFVGFVKALSKWKPLEEVRKTVRYHIVVDTFARQMQYGEAQCGTLRSRSNGARLPLRQAPEVDDSTPPLWDLLHHLPCREHMVVRLYFQYGPEPLTLAQFAALAADAGCTPQEVRTLQRRFRSILHRQHATSLSELTQDTIAALLDVDRETVRRLLAKARQHLQTVLTTPSEEVKA